MLTFFGPLYGLFILSSFAMRGTMYGFNDEPKKQTETNEEPKPKDESFFEKKFSRRSFFTLSYLKNF